MLSRRITVPLPEINPDHSPRFGDTFWNASLYTRILPPRRWSALLLADLPLRDAALELPAHGSCPKTIADPITHTRARRHFTANTFDDVAREDGT